MGKVEKYNKIHKIQNDTMTSMPNDTGTVQAKGGGHKEKVGESKEKVFVI